MALSACSTEDEASVELRRPSPSADIGDDDREGDGTTSVGPDAAVGPAAEEADAGPAPQQDAGVQPRGGDCVVGGSYCGGDKVIGDPKTLYKCNGPGAPTVIEKCATTCQVNPGMDDSCAPAPGTRVASPVPGKSVTYAFGIKNSNYAAGYHTGDDYAAPSGTNVVAVRNGIIRWSNGNGGSYGQWMGLEADNGRTYVYCHLSSRSLAAGATVTAGQVIGKVGSTGNSTGPHLHFEDHPKGPFVYGQVRDPSW